MEDTNFDQNNSFHLLNENIKNEQSNVNIIKKLIIHLNDEKLEFKEKIKLKDLRKMIEDIIEKLKNFKFKINEKIYDEKEEEKFTIEDIIEKKNPNELSIHLTKIKLKRSNSQLSKNVAKTNVPYKKENKNNINIKKINNFIKKFNNLEIKIYKNEPKFNDKELSNSKTIIMVGETGSGKTTMINSLTNYLSDVKLNDNYRYLLINEQSKDNKDNSHSQTSDVNIYYIRSKKKDIPNLRIIDTPGYGDTRGYEYDKKITKMIKDKFEKEIKIINSICFVAKSDKIRLSFEQNYVFYEVLSLFGKNIADNFIFLFTFCDNKEPLIINSLKENDPFKSFISKIKEPWYLKFNNSGFFENPNYDQFVEFFFDIGKESFNQFFKKLKTLDNKKVNISQILSEKKENDINNLDVKIKELLKKFIK